MQSAFRKKLSPEHKLVCTCCMHINICTYSTPLRHEIFTHMPHVCSQVGVEQEKVGKEKEIADAEEKKVAKINADVTKKQRDCETDLAKAEPALKVG